MNYKENYMKLLDKLETDWQSDGRMLMLSIDILMNLLLSSSEDEVTNHWTITYAIAKLIPKNFSSTDEFTNNAIDKLIDLFEDSRKETVKGVSAALIEISRKNDKLALFIKSQLIIKLVKTEDEFKWKSISKTIGRIVEHNSKQVLIEVIIQLVQLLDNNADTSLMPNVSDKVFYTIAEIRDCYENKQM